MFTGVDFDKAIECWRKGREVIVLDRTVKSPSGGYETYSFDELFRNLELLADVPAIENPDFSQTVAAMVHGSDQKLEESTDQESNTPPPTGPEVSDPLPAGTGKTKKDIALELAAQGMNAGQIARQIGAKYNTVYHWLNPEKCRPKSKKQEIPVDYKNPDAKPGWNADREKCKTCRYRQRKRNEITGGCDYISIAGHSRGCSVENCDRYVKGDRMEQKKGWVDE